MFILIFIDQINLTFILFSEKKVNQHPALTAVHVILLRQHNKIVNTLKELNIHMDGESLYLEAKRILSAQLQ